MALGNLSITVNADISRFVTSMDTASRAAQSGMGDSAASVDAFQTSLMQAAAEMERAAKAMSANMEAANDAIVSGSEQSAEAIGTIQQAADDIDFSSASEKFASAFGAGVGAGASAVDKAVDGFKSYVKTKLVITGIALIAGVSAAALSAAYVTYKVVKEAIGFIAGLFTGDSYKSESIDALIKTNDQVKELQSSLYLTAQQASATNAAIAAIGINKSDYTSVFSSAAGAIRNNTDELDRLGVKYKDAQGNVLPLEDVVQSANQVLNEYTAGWDRNQAASAIGLGSAEKVAAAALVTRDALAAAADRLNDYNLGIGADSQAAVKRYEDAMRDFNRENELTSEGFKRAWADNIMPLLTDLAEFFRDGFPFAVNAFRYSIATITSLFYGLKTVVYIVAESIVGSIAAIGAGLGGIATAGIKVFQGDFTGAKEALVAGWTDAKSRLGEIGDNIVAQARHNADAMKQAWALDDRNGHGMTRAKGKTWVPKPKDKDGPTDDPAKTILEGYLKSQDALIAAEKKSMETRQGFLKQSYDSEYINARTYYDEKRKLIADNYAATIEAYDREIAAVNKYKATLSKDSDKVKIAAADVKLIDITAKRAAAEAEASAAMVKATGEQLKIYSDFDRATIEWTRNQELANAQRQFEIDLMGKSALEAAKLTAARKIDLEVQERIRQLRLKDPNADVSGAVEAGAEQTRKAIELIQQQNDKQKDPWFNARESIRKYGEAANDVGTQIGNVLDNAFRGAEDAFVRFVQTGKLSFKSLATSILADIERILIKKAIAGIVDMAVGGFSSGFGFGSGGGAGSSAGPPGLWAGGDGAGAGMDIMSAAGGYDIPSGVNPLTQLHENEMVLPAPQADVIRGLAGKTAASSGDISINVTVNAQTGDSSTSSTGNARQLSQLGAMIGAKVREVIVAEKRSGGLLAT